MARLGCWLVLIFVLMLGGCGRTPGWSPLSDGSPGTPDIPPLPTSSPWFKLYELDKPGGQIRALATDCTGDSFMAGRFGGTFTIGKIKLNSVGADDLFIARLTPSGQTRWAISGGGPANEWITDMVYGPQGGIYIAGKLGVGAKLGSISPANIVGEHTQFVAKLNGQGKVLWVTPLGGGAKCDFMNTTGLALGPDGGLVVTGYYSGSIKMGKTTLPTRNGPFYGYVARLAVGGTVNWAKAIPTTEEVRTLDVAVDHGGGIYVSGYFSGKATFGAVSLASSKDPKKLKTADAFLTRLNPKNGGFVWTRQMGGDHDDAGVALAVDSKGNALLGGTFMGRATFGSKTLTARGPTGSLARDIFLARFSSSGSMAWVTQVGGPDSDVLSDLSSDSAGNAVYMGWAERPGAGTGRDTLLGLVDTAGVPRWTNWTDSAGGSGSPGLATGTDLALDNCTGHLIASGVLTGSARFWPPQVTAVADSSKRVYWLWKLSQSWFCQHRPACHTFSTMGSKCWASLSKDGTVCKAGAQSGVCSFGRCQVP
jgi:hypothetical protein